MIKNRLLYSLWTAAFCSIFSGLLQAQVPQNGLETSQVDYYLLTHATVRTSPSETLENVSVLVKGDQIVKIGKRVSAPKNAVEIDCSDKIILPAFIELSSSIGLPTPKAKAHNRAPQLDSRKKGAYYWNESIHPEIDAGTMYRPDKKASEALIKSGFGFALTHHRDGIARGKGAMVSLGTKVSKHLLPWGNASFFSFSKGISRQTYPSSQMGSIALLRQAFYDALWYARTDEKERDLSLEALNKQWKNPSFFYTGDKWEILRAAKIGKEFDRTFHYIGSGDEYGIIDELKELKGTVVVPITFPKAYDVGNPYVARQIPLSDLKHWEMAPYNPKILAENNIPFCITYAGHKNAKEFWEHLRTALKHGLSPEKALEALTLQPAKSLGIERYVGTLEAGKKASFTIFDKDPLKEDAKLLETWLLGERSIHDKVPLHQISGKYNILIDDRRFPLEIKGQDGKYKATVKVDTAKINATISTNENDISVRFNVRDSVWKGSVVLRGKINSKLGIFEGEGLVPTGEWVKWSAVRNGKLSDKKKSDKWKMQKDSLAVSWFPNMAYGFDSIPDSETIVIKNATVWTNEADGVMKNGTVIIQDGKIKYCGTRPPSAPGGARIIDAEGKHVTSGIIDEHSHIAIWKGVNEGGQAISAEVSIGDVVHPDDINIYRQLSGGVTAAQLLHGSANPIGGQSALIKLKWGHTPEEMLIDNAPGFIKFALGENVKQSNWGQYNTVRFPQTRMGVEQVFYDGFQRARDYTTRKQQFANGELKIKPRVDLELETLSEILDKKRFISCHSYVQSEINMLMHVADSMGFTLNTFTHILEGYKLADKMAAHGAGGSTFSDWWAYKYEVNEAIPYNAKMMHDHGVVVAINSDDAEMGRRLNQEAAKAVKYGGMSEEDAWKMVTLNPAKLLHLDDRMGSLKVGKDADVVVWSDHPLSVRAKVDYTVIDGTILYERETADNLYQRNQAEKARIISKMLKANAAGEKRDFKKKKKGHFHCNTLGEEGSLEENHH